MSNLPDITNLNEINNQQPTVANETSTTSVHVRTPKRILHFSDGTMEEYSDDDNGEDVIDQAQKNNDKQIDVVKLIKFPLNSIKLNDIDRISTRK